MDINVGKVSFKNIVVLKLEKIDDEELWNIDWDLLFIFKQLVDDKMV